MRASHNGHSRPIFVHKKKNAFTSMIHSCPKKIEKKDKQYIIIKNVWYTLSESKIR